MPLAPAWDWIAEVRPPVASHAKPLFEEEVRRALSRIRASDGRFSVAVSAAQLDWHLQRERVYAYLLDGILHCQHVGGFHYGDHALACARAVMVTQDFFLTFA